MLARRLLDALRVRNMAARISQIDVSDSRNAVVLLDGDPTLVRLGDDHFVERLQSYLDLAPALRERVSGMDYVDMRFDERVYVRPARGGAASASKTAGVESQGRVRRAESDAGEQPGAKGPTAKQRRQDAWQAGNDIWSGSTSARPRWLPSSRR